MPAVAVASTYHDRYLLLPRTPAEPHPRYLVPGAQPAVPPAFGLQSTSSAWLQARRGIVALPVGALEFRGGGGNDASG